MCKCKCVWWMVLGWNLFEDGACCIDFDCTPVSIRKAFARMCMGEGFLACEAAFFSGLALYGTGT